MGDKPMKTPPKDFGAEPEEYDFWHDDRQEKRELTGWRLGVLIAALHFGVLVLVALLAMWIGPVYAHQAPTGWAYPFECCSNKDCGEIPASAVVEGPNGFVVTILPGQHVMVKDAPVQYLIPYGTEKPSPDGLTHICLNPALKMLCFFTGNRGV